MKEKRHLGRPKKAEHEKVRYQRIAVYLEDYTKLDTVLREKDIKLTQAFKEMVKIYCKK